MNNTKDNNIVGRGSKKRNHKRQRSERGVESATMASGLPLVLDKRLFLVLMAIGCHWGEFAHATLSPILYVSLYMGIAYVSS